MTTTQRDADKALADAIAKAINDIPGDRHDGAEVLWDYDVQGFIVRTVVGGDVNWDLVIAAPGALFGWFRNREWYGGLGLRRTDSLDPAAVARTVVDRCGFQPYVAPGR